VEVGGSWSCGQPVRKCQRLELDASVWCIWVSWLSLYMCVFIGWPGWFPPI